MEQKPVEKSTVYPAEPRSIHRIVLTGFMGSGKSTIGNLLSQKLCWPLLDIDQQIEKISGSSAQQLFASQGETAFREFESQVTASCLSQENVIVALGGAAIDLPVNQALLTNSKSTLIVFLDADFEILIERCIRQEQTSTATYRPLLHKKEIALDRFTSRRKLNSQHAHLKVDVANRSCEETAGNIIEIVKQDPIQSRHTGSDTLAP
jgi:shikimate kinase